MINFSYIAAMNNNFRIVQSLIIAGADVNTKTNDGQTALMFGIILYVIFKTRFILYFKFTTTL